MRMASFLVILVRFLITLSDSLSHNHNITAKIIKDTDIKIGERKLISNRVSAMLPTIKKGIFATIIVMNISRFLDLLLVIKSKPPLMRSRTCGKKKSITARIDPILRKISNESR
jgi:hypothetical protein